jgi:light-harvesting complex I chlorophyll a/b binding protein 5
VDPQRLKWYAEGERINGRWAMAAVAGILFTDLLGKPKWFEAGSEEYWMPTAPLLAIEFLVLGFLELKRFQGWKETGTSGFLNAFPFDPAGMNSPSMATKEVKNGRLAMVAFIGFAVQALVTRQGPIEALTSHLSSPFENNLVGSIANLPNVIGK